MMVSTLTGSFEETEEYQDDELLKDNSPPDKNKFGEAPKFIIKPESINCFSGDKAVFHCKVVGAEPIDICWYNSTRELTDQNRIRIFANSPGSACLEIYDTEPQDSGEIVCLAVNEVSVVSAVAVLSVTDQDLAGEEPIFVEAMQSQSVSMFAECKFFVKATGHPEPRVVFYRNHQAIHSSSNKIITNHGDGCWSLVITSVALNDAGSYAAMAFNRIGKIVCKANLTIQQEFRTERRQNFDEKQTMIYVASLEHPIDMQGKPTPNARKKRSSDPAKHCQNR